MTYYTVNERTGIIMKSSDICPDPQAEANYFGDPVYIIRGQHTGLTATPQTTHLCESCVHLPKLLAWCTSRFDVEQVAVGNTVRTIECTGWEEVTE